MLVEQVMGERKAYPSDLTDQQWAVVGPFLDAWKARHPSVSGHQGRYPLREIVNAIFYQNRTGCQWAYLPHDLPAEVRDVPSYAKVLLLSTAPARLVRAEQVLGAAPRTDERGDAGGHQGRPGRPDAALIPGVGMDLSEVNDLKASAKGARDDKDWPAALLDLHDALD